MGVVIHCGDDGFVGVMFSLEANTLNFLTVESATAQKTLICIKHLFIDDKRTAVHVALIYIKCFLKKRRYKQILCE